MRLYRSGGKIPPSFISLSVLRLSVISGALVLPVLYTFINDWLENSSSRRVFVRNQQVKDRMFRSAELSLYIVCRVLIMLCYTLGLAKSVLTPTV